MDVTKTRNGEWASGQAGKRETGNEEWEIEMGNWKWEIDNFFTLTFYNVE